MIRVVHRTWKERRSMSIQENSSPSVFRSRSKNGGSRPVGYNDQQKITIMLVTVSMVFLICIIPGALNSIATHVFRSYSPVGENKNLYMLISTIAFLLETINSSVNFIIYMAMSKRFRLMNKETLCCGNGEYYRKISFSSVKEQFRWSSSKKHNRYQEHPLFDRRTVSDIGPLLNVSNGNAGGRRWSDEAHSEGWELRSHERGSGIGHKIPETISEEPSPQQSKHCLQILQTKTLKKLLVSKRKKKTKTSLLPDRHLKECNGNCSNGDSVDIM
ncbi:uncharacterized protein LOC128229972 [Mya arenaria]|uniref:uncharacterized protein LOC128229972 n=1 Tax=Mya arenaria TaxID=6604 RepID=UPI0022E0B678|nr:uncharacterized protein LOC128229972 [Mya arenaria]